jgi:methylated-DNA-[protein]-cysteine S-methyltransferase
MNYGYIDSPVGKLLIAGSDAGICLISFPKGKDYASQSGWIPNLDPLSEAVQQVEKYFSGELKIFALKLDIKGTLFQLKVWDALRAIPYGRTVSYGDIAHRIGSPGAARAVGGAVGRNPVPIVIPCHRVIGTNGKLTGFGGGMDVKETLLALERIHVKSRMLKA